MKLISEYEAPPELRVQCEAFRILGSYKEEGDGLEDKTDQNLKKKDLVRQLFDLCEKESDFLDVFIAANTLSKVRFNKTNFFDNIIQLLIKYKKVGNHQPVSLNSNTMKYLYNHDINIAKPFVDKFKVQNKKLLKIISDDDLDEFIKYTLIQIPPKLKVNFGTRSLEGSILSIACALNAERIVRYLTAFNKDFTSAIKIAVAFGNIKILRILEQSGGNVIEGYDAAVATHKYEINDWMRLNYPDRC